MKWDLSFLKDVIFLDLALIQTKQFITTLTSQYTTKWTFYTLNELMRLFRQEKPSLLIVLHNIEEFLRIDAGFIKQVILQITEIKSIKFLFTSKIMLY